MHCKPAFTSSEQFWPGQVSRCKCTVFLGLLAQRRHLPRRSQELPAISALLTLVGVTTVVVHTSASLPGLGFPPGDRQQHCYWFRSINNKILCACFIPSLKKLPALNSTGCSLTAVACAGWLVAGVGVGALCSNFLPTNL